ncbi:MAG: response regulator transcription factor [Lachnospiraceae bacterium]|nr:response regulator transcription factor [Lachnospiraceae bacterium]MBO5146880.1 response regulator transcription factor [Lachnospiraceae bacterium]
MDELQIALCEDQADEQAQLAGLIRSGIVPASVSLFGSGETFLEEYRPGRFDLVFMDIYMDGITGVETVRRIRQSDARLPIVFVTSSREYALDAYRLEVAKYIEKPVTQRAVDEALLLAREKREQQSIAVVILRGREYRLPVNRLICAEQKGHYLVLSYEGNRKEQVRGRLDELAPQLPAFPFLRCHKSYLANLDHVTGIDRELLLLHLREGGVAYIRREYLKKTVEAWEDWLFSQARKDR